MATINEIRKACEVLARLGQGDSHNVCAEHDELWIGHDMPVADMSPEDRAAMAAAGWEWGVDGIYAWHIFT